MSEPRFVNLAPGDPAPWFRQRTSGNPDYVFDSAGGRWLVLCFFGAAGEPHAAAAIAAARTREDVFNDIHAAFFGVSLNPADAPAGLLAEKIPGVRLFHDFDGAVSRLYGALPQESEPAGGRIAMRRFWAVLDPTLRVKKIVPFAADRSDIAAVTDYLAALPPPERFAGFEIAAPVLVLPDVFEPAFCERLIALYEAAGGEESGSMREVNGRTVGVMDYSHKRRRDYSITDQAVIRASQEAMRRRVAPEILKIHHFRVTRMERYIVACYLAEDGGHFRQHRDNTTKGTAHRRYAVSINLNKGYEGGDISFPEYGPRTYRAPPGGAVVFSCSLLHMVSPVTRGRRYAFLPFLYDEPAAKLRERNSAFLAEGARPYRAAAATTATASEPDSGA